MIKGAEKYLGKTIGKYAAKGLGEAAGAYGAATLMPQTHSGIIDRMLGDTKRDKDGNILFDEKTAGSTAGSIYKGMTSSMLEVLTERFGEGVAPLLGKIPKMNLAGKIVGPAGEEAMKRFSSFTKAIGWNGVPLEFAEEYINIPLNALLVGDSKYSDMFDGDQQLDTFLTVLAMGGAMTSVQAGVNAIAKGVDNRRTKDFKHATSLYESTIDEPTRLAVNSILDNQGLTLEQESTQLHRVLSGIDNGEQAGTILNYVASKYRLEGEKFKQPKAQPNSGPQFTVNPRETKEAELRQFAQGLAHAETGTLTKIIKITGGMNANIPMFVAQSDDTGGYLLQDDLGNKEWYKPVTQSDIETNEMTVDDYVAQNMADYDQNTQKKDLADNNKMVFNNRVINRSDNPNENRTEDSEYWFDHQTEQEVEVPLSVVESWEKQKAETKQGMPNFIKTVYGKTNVTGTKNEDGSITVTEPSTIEQANTLRKEVEKSTGGNATVKADLIPNEDFTAPQAFQLSIVPNTKSQVKDQVNNESVTEVASQDNGLITEAPKERNITTQRFGSSDIDMIKEEGFHEVVATDKMPLEKALPILEKKFKDHKKFKLEVEKSHVEIPGETKWDDSTFKTVVKSIRIYPVQVAVSENIAPTQKVAEPITESVTNENPILATQATVEGTMPEDQGIVASIKSSKLEQQSNEQLNSELTNTDQAKPENKKESKPFSYDAFRTIPTLEEMKSKINELQKIAPGAAPVFIAQSVDELPEAIRNHTTVSDGINGVFYNGKVYIMAENVKSKDHLIATWVHENGIHNGIRNLLPVNERRIFMNKVHDSFREIAKRNPEYKSIFNKVKWDYSDRSKDVQGEEMLAWLAQEIVSEKDLTPELQSVWHQIKQYFRNLLSKLYEFDGNLLTENQIDEIIFVSIQSNFQENEHTSSSKRGSGSISKGEQNNADGSKGNTFRTGEFQDQSGEGIQDQDGSGRILDRNRTDTENILKEARLKAAESIQEQESNDSSVLFQKGQMPLLTLLDEASKQVKQNRKDKRTPDKVRTGMDRFLSKFVQANMAVKNLIEKFDLKVPDYANVFLALNQKSSRQMGQMKNFERKLYNPFLDSIGKIIAQLEKGGLTKQEAYESVKKYMIARHAPERNEWFRSLGKKGDVFSGMTDEEAQGIYEAFESKIPKELIDDLWNKTRNCTERVAMSWVDYGRYDQSTVDSMFDRNWEYYVPLRGHEPIADEIELDYDLSEKKSDFAGNDKAEGRQSMADDPIAYIYQMADSAIMFGEKNKVKRTAYNLIKLNSDKKEFFEIAQVNYMKDKIGVETEVVYEASGTTKGKDGKEKPDYTVYLLNIDKDRHPRPMTDYQHLMG